MKIVVALLTIMVASVAAFTPNPALSRGHKGSLYMSQESSHELFVKELDIDNHNLKTDSPFTADGLFMSEADFSFYVEGLEMQFDVEIQERVSTGSMTIADVCDVLENESYGGS